MLVCIQVKQKSFITADVIGTIQNNPDLVINYENFIMSSMWNINRGKFFFKSTKPSYVCLLLLMCDDIEQFSGPPFPELSNLSRNKGIKVLHQNIRGLFNKIPDIQIILYQFNLHVLKLSETQINSNNYNDEDSLYDIPGYDFIYYLDKNKNNDIKDIFMLNGYKQLVTKATWITENSKTLIDKIFTNKPENISKTDTIPTSLSDHDMVGCVRKLNHLKYESKTIHWRNYKDYDPKALQKDLQEQSWVTYYSFKEPNSAWIYLKSILTHLFDKMHLKLKRKSKAVIVHA